MFAILAASLLPSLGIILSLGIRWKIVLSAEKPKSRGATRAPLPRSVAKASCEASYRECRTEYPSASGGILPNSRPLSNRKESKSHHSGDLSRHIESFD